MTFLSPPGINGLKLVHDYLSNRKQWTKINSTYSSWHKIIFGVLQGSILGPLLCNIFLINLFFIIEDFDIGFDIANDNAPCLSANNINEIFKSLEEASTKLFKWFRDNLVKSNADISYHKRHRHDTSIYFDIKKVTVRNS